MKRKYFSILNIIILSMIMFSNANAQSIDDKESARIFVQKFYDWYSVLYDAPLVKRQPVPSITAINQKADYFDIPLRKALIDDREAQLKVKGEIVGLDFDPFLAAQDNGFAYQTGNVKQLGNKFFVDVHCDRIGKSRKSILAAEVAVIAEVVKMNGNWKFINFIYPPFKEGHDDLLHILKSLREDRDKTTK